MGLGIKTKSKYALKEIKKVFSRSKSDDLDILLICHALEKGMGVQDVKRGYGQEKAKKLLLLLEAYPDHESYAFQEACAILKAYFSYQKNSGVNISDLEKRFISLSQNSSLFCSGGYRVLSGWDFLKGTEFDLKGFLESRHSMRAYSDQPVSQELLLEAVRLAERAPSACNRQPWKVYFANTKEINVQIADALPAQSFLNDVPYYCALTVDSSLFTPAEIHQWYINGGIFLAYFTLALHNKGIGSCIFQYNVYSASSGKLRKMLGIGRTEEIIAIVGYGCYPPEAKCLIADRRPITDIARFI